MPSSLRLHTEQVSLCDFMLKPSWREISALAPTREIEGVLRSIFSIVGRPAE
jgi:hypothetical protein